MTDPSRVPRSLPRGRSRLPREVVLLSQRARLVEAAIDVVGTHGFAATSVADVIGSAHVSRTTFYEQFRDKEECFIAAYEERAGSQLEQVQDAAKRVVGPIARLQAGVREYLAALADEPAYARMALVEVLAAGPEAAVSRDLTHRRYAKLLQKWHGEVRADNPAIPQMPEEVFDCAVGGISDLLARRVRAGDAGELPGLAPVIVTFLLNLSAVPAGRELAAALAASRARRT